MKDGAWSAVVNFHRVFRTLSAHIFGQGVTVFGVVAIPWVCLGHWSAEEFGVWIVATAMSLFFLVSDGGLASVLSNHLCMEDMSAKKMRETVLQSFKLILRRIISAILVAVIVASGWYAWESRGIKVADISRGSIVFFFSVLSTALQPLVGIFCAVMRYRGRNGTGIFISNLTRFFELVALIVAVYMGAGLLVSAIIIAVTKVIVTSCLMAFVFMRVETEGGIGIPKSQPELLTSDLKRSGFGVASNFFALNLLLHGLVIIASLGGPVAAAIFSSARTVTRLPVQPLGIAYLSIGPEITDIYSRRDPTRLRRIAFIMVAGALLFAVAVGGSVLVFHEWLEQAWLHGKVKLPFDLLAVMILSMLAHVVWQSGYQILGAINQTYKLGLTYLAIGFLTLAAAALAQATTGLLGIGVAWVFAEFLMCFAVWRCLANVFSTMQQCEN